MIAASHWKKFREHFFFDKATGFALDISCMDFHDTYLDEMRGRMQTAFKAMDELENGAKANPDEDEKGEQGRRVGHYWLRTPELCREPEKSEILQALEKIKIFADSVRDKFESMLLIGIGGSALGPKFVTHALADGEIATYFFDNVDPDGMEKTLATIPSLEKTLTLVISKSGRTKETRNGFLIARKAYQNQGIDFSRHAVAITGTGSELDNVAVKEGWLERFPMWDWVGGRTSELSAVGLLPAALQGIEIDALLAGARDMDALTRNRETRKNPAAMLALMWLHATEKNKKRIMAILPYKDRLELLSRYLQQLIMESLGKEKQGGNEGIVVFGNKGSTDQHAYVQQLRDGTDNFFAVFIEVLKDRSTVGCKKLNAVMEEIKGEGATCGDYLSGFYQGTRSALLEKGRESITVTIGELSPHSIGMLIALFERAVGYYASLVGINAYHQPGVEAGKKAAGEVLNLQQKIVDALKKTSDPVNIEEIAEKIDESDRETVFKILRRLAANSLLEISPGKNVFEDKYYNVHGNLDQKI